MYYLSCSNLSMWSFVHSHLSCSHLSMMHTFIWSVMRYFACVLLLTLIDPIVISLLCSYSLAWFLRKNVINVQFLFRIIPEFEQLTCASNNWTLFWPTTYLRLIEHHKEMYLTSQILSNDPTPDRLNWSKKGTYMFQQVFP